MDAPITLTLYLPHHPHLQQHHSALPLGCSRISPFRACSNRLETTDRHTHTNHGGLTFRARFRVFIAPRPRGTAVETCKWSGKEGSIHGQLHSKLCSVQCSAVLPRGIWVYPTPSNLPRSVDHPSFDGPLLARLPTVHPGLGYIPSSETPDEGWWWIASVANIRPRPRHYRHCQTLASCLLPLDPALSSSGSGSTFRTPHPPFAAHLHPLQSPVSHFDSRA